jgi:hypothetical protein
MRSGLLRAWRRGVLLSFVLAALGAMPGWAAPPTKTPSKVPPKQRGTAATQTTLGEQMLIQGHQMIAYFGRSPGSKYAHKTNIDAASGVCEVDCSGFVGTILEQVSPFHLQQIIKPKGRARPLAEDFQTTFAAAATQGVPGWLGVVRVADMKGEDTGHVVMLDAPPVAERSGQWRLRIIDSTKSPHGDDTRAEGQSGVGGGTIFLTVDAQGRPIGYRWKTSTGTLHEMPISIGRAMPVQ